MELKLYMKETCPFCKRVMRYIEKTGRTDVQFMDILADDENRKKLVEAGGKQQVPCLFINGEPLYESMDIVRWLDSNPQK